MNLIKIKDLVSKPITKGTTPSSIGFKFLESGEINFFKVENFKNGLIDNFKCKYINNDCHIKMKRSQLEEGDILVSIAGTIGESVIVSKQNLPANINQAIAIIRLNKNENIDYIHYQIKNIKKKLVNNSNKGVISNLNLSTLEDIEIFYPDHLTQTKIANILNKHSKNIKHINTLLEKIEIRNNYYADKLLAGELSIKNDKISTDSKIFDTIILNDVLSTKISSGTTPKNIKTENFEGSINYIKIENIKNGVLNKKYFIDEITNEKMKRSILKENDILITIAGTIGKVFMVSKEHLPANINQAFAIIRVNERYDNDYIFQICKCLDKQISKDKNSGAIQNLNISNISNFEINVFKDIEYQKQISNFLKILDEEKSKIQRLLELEEKRFEWLSDKLLSGEYIIE